MEIQDYSLLCVALQVHSTDSEDEEFFNDVD